MQFARDHPQVTVVGLGAGSTTNGDSLDLAYSFVQRHGADTAGMTMIYDVSFDSWRSFGVTTQPWLVVYDANGKQIYNRPGRIDLGSVVIALGL